MWRLDTGSSVKPVPGGGLTWAEGRSRSPLREGWGGLEMEDGAFSIEVEVPINTTRELVMPGGETHTLGSGKHRFEGLRRAGPRCLAVRRKRPRTESAGGGSVARMREPDDLETEKRNIMSQSSEQFF